MDKQFDVSPEELDRIRRRAEIRQKLKADFNRIHYNPYRMVYRLETMDPAVQRFMAARASRYDYWKPTWKSFFIWFGTHIVPILAFGYYLTGRKRDFEHKCRTGQIKYADRENKWAFVMTSI